MLTLLPLSSPHDLSDEFRLFEEYDQDIGGIEEHSASRADTPPSPSSSPSPRPSPAIRSTSCSLRSTETPAEAQEPFQNLLKSGLVADVKIDFFQEVKA